MRGRFCAESADTANALFPKYYGGQTYIMDPTILILIAIIILIIILIFYLKKSKKDTASKDTKEVIPKDAKTPPQPPAVPPSIPEQPAPPVKMSGALYIPPEMLGDRRNEEVRRKVDETIRNFDWDADGGRSEFLYTLQLNKSGWICPYCEGENDNEDPLCMICGTRIGA